MKYLITTFLLLSSYYCFDYESGKICNDLKSHQGLYSSISTINNTPINWHIDRIELDEAHAIETGSTNVKIGVIDTGILSSNINISNNVSRYGHVDFTDSSVLEYLDIENYDSSSIDFSNIPLDNSIDVSCAHGTNVAGLIAGYGTLNGINVEGVCENVTLYSLKVQNGYSLETNQLNKLAAAIDYAEYLGIDILNVSLGYTGLSNNFAINNAINNFSGLIVCAAGNSFLNIDSNVGDQKIFPIQSTANHIIGVGASNYEEKIWVNRTMDTVTGSNYGSVSVDLFAPGSDISIIDTDILQTSYIGSGTSFAVPLVTGTAALLKSKYPHLGPIEIKRIILDMVDIPESEDTTNLKGVHEIDNYEDKCVTNGRLNTRKALTFDDICLTYVLKYAYFDGNYHFAKCYCGKSIKQVHVVKAGSNICALCNGTTNMGGIGFTSLSYKQYINEDFTQIDTVITIDEESYNEFKKEAK